MGTRHLIAVQVDGEYKIAQYGQWDGYPEGQGITILAFLQSADLDLFREKCRATQWITTEELEGRWVEAGAKRGEDFVSMDTSGKFAELYPEFSRSTSAKILQIVLDQPAGLRLTNNISFAQDSLFCEWAYVVDLDANTFEVWEGFKKEAVESGRFAGPLESGHDNAYGPVQMARSWPLDALPTGDEFLAALNRLEDAA